AEAATRPYVSTDDPDFAAAADAGYFLVDGTGAPRVFTHGHQSVAQVDLTNPAARAWYGRALAAVVALGFDGWTHDGGEHTPPDATTAGGETGLVHHNRYPALWAELGRDVLEATRPGGDFVVVSRTAGPGQHAATSVFAGGEASTDFEPSRGLPSSLRGLLSAGLSGLAIWATDVGGGGSFGAPGPHHEPPMVLAR